MDHTRIDTNVFGTQRDGFLTDSENWPPNVKAAHQKAVPQFGAFGA